MRTELLAVEPLPRTMGSEREELWDLTLERLHKQGCPEFVDGVMKWASANSLSPKVGGTDDDRTIKNFSSNPEGLILIYIDWSSKYHGTSPPSRDGYIVRFGVDFVSRYTLDRRQKSRLYSNYDMTGLFRIIHGAAKKCGWYSSEV